MNQKRKFINIKGIAFLLFLIFSNASQLFATATGEFSISNCTVGANYIEFQLNVKNTSNAGEVFYLSTAAPFRMNLSAGIIPAGTNTYTWAYVPGSADASIAPLYATLGTSYVMSYNAGTRVMQITNTPGILGTSTATVNCPIQPGATLNCGKFRLTITNTNFVANQSAGLAWVTTSGFTAYVNTATTTSNFNTTNRTLVTPCSLTTPAACVAPTLSASVTNQICPNQNNGAINLTAANGSPTPTFAWSGPNSFSATTEDISGLAPGNYTVIASSGTCTSTDTYTVGSASPISSSFSATGCGSYPLPWGETATSSGPYTHTYTSAAGCDSVVTANITITQIPNAPTGLSCWQTATFNSATCSYDITGTQPSMPTLACYETATFNTGTCAWVVTGTQPVMPTLACYETATFNTTSCAWDVTGTQPAMPTLACYETANFNTSTCAWVVSGTQPAAPTGLACYETANFNTSTCAWVVSGTQPAAPTGLACYETASFNTSTCAWVITGSQPTQPTATNCWDNYQFNTTSCTWVNTGSQPTQPTATNCWDNYQFNTTSCTWVNTGTQPTQPEVGCNQIATFNNATCQWDVTGSPAVPVVTTTSSCQSYTWTTNNQTYTSSGNYTYVNGCTTNILNLTINTSSSSNNPIFICASQVPYSWNGGSYSTSGTYTYHTNNAVGCDSLATLVLTVGESIPNPVTSVVQPTCSVATGTITITSPLGSGLQYSIGGAYQSSTTFASVPSGSYSVTVRTVPGCISSSSTATVNPQPIVPEATSVAGQVNVCNVIGTNNTLSYTATAIGAISFTWIAPPFTTLISGQGTETITLQFLSGFTTSVNKQLRVVANSTCGSNATKIFYLAAQLPTTPSAIVASSTNICPSIENGSTISYTIPKVAGALSYIWTAQTGTTTITHPNGLGDNDTTVLVSFSSGFTASNITVKAVNNCGIGGAEAISSSRSYSITRNNPSQPGLISGPTNPCENIGSTGTIATYSVNAVNNVTSYTWVLPVGATNINGQGTSSVSFKFPVGFTTGSISVTASNGCGTSTARSLSLSRLLPARPSGVDVINVSTCPNRVYTYSISSIPANATSILWAVPAGGTITSGQGTNSISVTYTAGLINGNLTATALSNCGSSSERVVAIKLAPCPSSGKTTMPITGKTNGVIQNNMEVKVFPNPSTTSFNLLVQNSEMSSNVKVRVLDLQGRLIKIMTITPNQTVSLGAEFKAGVYMLEVRAGDAVKVTRIVKY